MAINLQYNSVYNSVNWDTRKTDLLIIFASFKCTDIRFYQARASAEHNSESFRCKTGQQKLLHGCIERVTEGDYSLRSVVVIRRVDNAISKTYPPYNTLSGRQRNNLFCQVQGRFQLSVEDNQAITLVLVLLRFETKLSNC